MTRQNVAPDRRQRCDSLQDEFDAYDRLPKAVRHALQSSKFNFSSIEVLDAYRDRCEWLPSPVAACEIASEIEKAR